MKRIWRVGTCLLILWSMLVLQGCGDSGGSGDSFGARIGLVPPPISVTFRESLIKGYVMQLHNRSDNRVVATVYVENKKASQSRKVSVSIAPNEMEELGLLEMDWAFESGENGYVSADGFTQRIYFEVEDGGRYKVW